MNKIKEEQSEKAAPPKRRGKLSKVVTRVLSGDFLTRKEVVEHIPFVLYVSAFFLFSIYIGYSYDNTEREKISVKRTLKEKNAEYKTLKTQLEARRQRSQLAGEITALGLIEPSEPPVIIEITKEELEKQN